MSNKWPAQMAWSVRSLVSPQSWKWLEDVAATTVLLLTSDDAGLKERDMWTFGRKIAAGFTLAFLLLVVIGGGVVLLHKQLAQPSDCVCHTPATMEHPRPH